MRDVGVTRPAHLAFVLHFRVGVSGSDGRNLVVRQIAGNQLQQFVDRGRIGDSVPPGLFRQPLAPEAQAVLDERAAAASNDSSRSAEQKEG